MREQALQVVESEATDRAKRNRLREYLQHVVLRELFEQKLLGKLVFHGGTALRITHDLARFSEDLDFHLKEPQPDFDLTSDLDTVRKRLEENGYDVTLSTSLGGNVKSSMIRFAGLLFECGLTPHPHQNLNVKLEIEANPPAGFGIQTSTINKYFPYVIYHHDRPTFLAGKLHAILQRRHTKGRDYYDLVFYLNRWMDVEPNIPYLNHALAQTGYKGAEVSLENWRKLVAQKVESLNWKQVIEDLEPFLLRSKDRDLVNKELLLDALKDKRSGG